nr:unnamed protein product [Spirometra erinaceieuropaei]
MSEAGLRPRAHPHQSHFLCHANGRRPKQTPSDPRRLQNGWRVHSRWRLSTTTVHEFLSADNCAINATSEVDIQRSIDFFVAACDNFGLVINTEETVVMHRPPPNAAYNAPQINVNGTQTQAMGNFTYLGSILSRNTKTDDEAAAGFPSSQMPTTSTSQHQRSITTELPTMPADVPDTKSSIRTTPPNVTLQTSASPPSTPIDTDLSSSRPLPSSFSNASTSATAATLPTTTAHHPDAPSNINLTTVNTTDVNSIHACPRCDPTFTSHIGFVGHLRSIA